MTVMDDRSGHARSDARMSNAGPVGQSPAAQRGYDAQIRTGGGSTSAGSQCSTDAHTTAAASTDVLDGHGEVDTHLYRAAEGQASVSHRRCDTQLVTADGSTSADLRSPGAQMDNVGGAPLAAADAHTAPICGSPQQPLLPAGTAAGAAPKSEPSRPAPSPSAEANAGSSPAVPAPQLTPSPSAATNDGLLPIEPAPRLTDPLPAGADDPTAPDVPAPRLADIQLALLAEAVDDLERTRIANENRWRSLIQVYGLEGTPQEKTSRALVDGLVELEHRTTLQLAKAMRAHPLGGWVKAQRGVGEKQAARLLAAIGDPYWNALHDRPRTVSELWAFAGLHALPVSHATFAVESGQRTSADGPILPAGQGENGDRRVFASGSNVPAGQVRDDTPTRIGGGDSPPGSHAAARRRKGVKSNWSGTAKMRAYLIATSCVKQLKPGCKADGETVTHEPGCGCSPYRIDYDRRRAVTSVTHPEWTPLHSHNDGLRIAAKAMLRDLWREAQRLHGTSDA